ncbi:MAG TPA: hypothetical protein PKE63_12710 [Lacibacter sp.]|nr:hypothetical protein [Lacibacter sp.]HMO87701.1 hypothetical protein [Lacibacter sp.]HMP88133.1 hypothetical protein [Lacibacter sp.]
MKHTLLLSLFALTLFTASAQEKGWNRERVFLGSGINLSFFNGFIVGLNPEAGYTVGKVLDVGLATNFTYITQNYINSPATDRLLIAGGGPFVRIWPVNMLFLGGQFEYNIVSFSTRQSGQTFNKSSFSAPSMLVGAGYGNRFIGQSQFYTSLMVDVLKDPNSPYVDRFGRMQPVFRTAFTFYLKQKKVAR